MFTSGDRRNKPPQSIKSDHDRQELSSSIIYSTSPRATQSSHVSTCSYTCLNPEEAVPTTRDPQTSSPEPVWQSLRSRAKPDDSEPVVVDALDFVLVPLLQGAQGQLFGASLWILWYDVVCTLNTRQNDCKCVDFSPNSLLYTKMRWVRSRRTHTSDKFGGETYLTG